MFFIIIMKRKSLYILLLLVGVILVLVLCAVMGVMAYRHKRQTEQFRQAEEAYKQGDFDVASQRLLAYVRQDPSHEKAWFYLAEINERNKLWSDAASNWHRLISLNVLNNEYVKRAIMANYRAHNFSALAQIFSTIPSGLQNEYPEIYALTQFIAHPDAEATEKLVAAIPQDGSVARLIRVFKNSGPASELEALENCDDSVIKIEAFMHDAFLAENKTKDFERADKCLRKAVELNPDLCSHSLGDFLFRHIRYKEANEVYKSCRSSMMTDNSFLNYAEVLFFLKDEDGLSRIENEVHKVKRFSVPLRAYFKSLQAYLNKDSQTMVKNYKVAQTQRATPVGLLLSYAVAAEDMDIPLMVSVLSHWQRTKIFKEKQAEILANMRKMLAKAIKENKLEDASKLAQLFLRQEPPELICWQVVVMEQVARDKLSMNLILQASKLFPNERFFHMQGLKLALANGDKESVLALYDQLIATGE